MKALISAFLGKIRLFCGAAALICIGGIFLWSIPVHAQGEGELILTLSRNFGFSSGGLIQGTFSMKVSSPDNLQRVVFLIDRQPIGEDSQAPFTIQFHTGTYSLGVHSLSAVGYTADGRELHSNEIRREFVTAQEGWQTGLRIAIPIIAVSFGFVLLSALLPVVFGRRKSAGVPLGAPRSYGMLGGTICPKCGRPFGIHLWGINLLAGKLDRCPYCGKWSVVRRVPWEALQAAEAAELEQAKSQGMASAPSSEDSQKKELDDSRYMDV